MMWSVIVLSGAVCLLSVGVGYLGRVIRDQRKDMNDMDARLRESMDLLHERQNIQSRLFKLVAGRVGIRVEEERIATTAGGKVLPMATKEVKA